MGDITYVRLGHFVYVSLLKSLHRMIRAWHLSQHLIFDLETAKQALRQNVPEIHAIIFRSIFQMLISQRSGIMTLRFPSQGAGTPKG